MRHIFQELKNRIMGEKKHNLSGPITARLTAPNCLLYVQRFQVG